MLKDKSISLRIEPSLLKELKSICKTNDCSMSDVMRDGIIHKTGGAIKLFEAPEPTGELGKLLATLGGGSAIGILSYKAVYEQLKNKYSDWEEDELQTYAIISGVVCSLLAGVGLNKLLKLIN
jgi:hypothetical protein